jgi:hypothetical protein
MKANHPYSHAYLFVTTAWLNSNCFVDRRRNSALKRCFPNAVTIRYCVHFFSA